MRKIIFYLTFVFQSLSCILFQDSQCYNADQVYAWFLVDELNGNTIKVKTIFTRDSVGGFYRVDLCSNFEVKCNGNKLSPDVLARGEYFTYFNKAANSQYEFVVYKDQSEIFRRAFAMPAPIIFSSPANGSLVTANQPLTTTWTPQSGMYMLYWKSGQTLLTTQSSYYMSTHNAVDNGQYTIPGASVIKKDPADLYFSIYADPYMDYFFNASPFKDGNAHVTNSNGSILNLVF